MWVETTTSVKAAGQGATVKAATIPAATLMDAAVLGEAATEQDAATVRAAARVEAANQATREAVAVDATALEEVVV